MRVALFYHSLLSCWNNGNAHFLRGIAAELAARGHEAAIFEPADGWSRSSLLAEQGPGALDDAAAAFPALSSATYDPATIDLDAALDGADLVIVHEWNEPNLVAHIGAHRARVGGYRLLFHDTHHRALTGPKAMTKLDLRDYDGVLAFGRVVRDQYLAMGWAQRAWIWHEAADTRVFYPMGHDRAPAGDLVWVGNWGDGERSEELREFLLRPVRRLKLQAMVYGVRYPTTARRALARARIGYGGWLPNHRVPEVFGHYRVTIHVPRRPYARVLPGIPTIRVYEALACGIPLVSAPWEDAEGLFTPGEDFLTARDGEEMARHVAAVLADRDLAAALSARGLATIRARHTCAHRVDELLAIAAEMPLP